MLGGLKKAGGLRSVATADRSKHLGVSAAMTEHCTQRAHALQMKFYASKRLLA